MIIQQQKLPPPFPNETLRTVPGVREHFAKVVEAAGVDQATIDKVASPMGSEMLVLLNSAMSGNVVEAKEALEKLPNKEQLSVLQVLKAMGNNISATVFAIEHAN